MSARKAEEQILFVRLPWAQICARSFSRAMFKNTRFRSWIYQFLAMTLSAGKKFFLKPWFSSLSKGGMKFCLPTLRGG